jgi:hypothetical protein
MHAMHVSAYLAQREETPEFDQTMEISESNVNGNEDDVCRVAEEVAPELDCFAEEVGPRKQEQEQIGAIVVRPFRRCLVKGQEDKDIVG